MKEQMPEEFKFNLDINKKPIDNLGDFSIAFMDAKNELMQMKNYLKLLSEEDFLKQNSEIDYKYLNEYLNNYSISDEVKSSPSSNFLTKKYDSFIDKLKNIKSKEEYKEIIKDINEQLSAESY